MIEKGDTALIVIDAQNDFLPGGALAVEEGNEILPYINSIIDNFSLSIATMDWHPENHISFSSNHKHSKPGDVIFFEGNEQILWPDHCIQNTFGSEISSDLDSEKFTHIVYKGTDPYLDSYSGFYDNSRKKHTHLNFLLKSLNIRNLHICGLATDYCVMYTACDAISLGYNVCLHKEGCRAVNLKESDEENAIMHMETMGVTIY